MQEYIPQKGDVLWLINQREYALVNSVNGSGTMTIILSDGSLGYYVPSPTIKFVARNGTVFDINNIKTKP